MRSTCRHTDRHSAAAHLDWAVVGRYTHMVKRQTLLLAENGRDRSIRSGRTHCSVPFGRGSGSVFVLGKQKFGMAVRHRPHARRSKAHHQPVAAAMAVLRASPLLLPQPVSPASASSHPRRRVTAAAGPASSPSRGVTTCGAHGRAKKRAPGGRRSGAEWRGAASCLPTKAGEVGVAGGGEEQEEDEYLVREAGWGVRRMGRVGEEMRRVALVQAEAFHVPVALFNDFFFDFFKAEVLSALIYRVRNSPPDRYACLVAEDADGDTQLLQAPYEKIVGVVDCTVQDEADILNQIKGVDEYFYVSGIAVLPSFRRQKVGTALLKACEALALQWRHRFMALRAYEDDDGARGLYSRAGYRVVSKDPDWVTWIGRRRRVLMIKELPVHDHDMEQQ